jgi:repressor LexA
MMKTELGQYIEEWLTEHDKSQGWLAYKTGLTPAAISRIINQPRKPKAETLLALAEAMRVDSAVLFEMAGYAVRNLPEMLRLHDEPFRQLPGAECYPVGPSVQIPVLGTIKAGQPILMAEHVIGYESADWDTVRGGEYFYLRVKGDSMEPDHIPEGAYVLVRCQPTVEYPDIAVVIVNGDEACLKRVKFTDGQAILTSSNPRYMPQLYPASEVEVIGMVVEIKIKKK